MDNEQRFEIVDCCNFCDNFIVEGEEYYSIFEHCICQNCIENFKTIGGDF